MLKGCEAERGATGLFKMFCIWTFVLLCRPQDMFPFLGALRPALSTGMLTLLLVFIQQRELKGPPFFNERQVKYFTALLFVMVFGIPFSLYPRLSFMTIFTGYLSVVLFFYIFYKVVDSVAKLCTVLLVGCLGTGLYTAFSVASGSLGSGRLAFGGMFDPNDLAFFTLAFLPLNLLFISRDNPRWVRLACIGSFGAGTLLILLTGSRGGFLAFAVAAAILLLGKTRTIGFSLKVVVISMCVVFIGLSSVDTERYQTILEVEQDYNVTAETGRLAIWKIGMRAFLANPLTGVGVNCFNEAVGRDREARDLNVLKWQTAHNSVVQIGTETGIVGLALFLAMSLNVFRIFGRIKRTACEEKLVKIGEMGIVAFAGLCVAGLLLSQAYSFYWAFYVAFSAIANQLIAKEQAIGNQHG